jgi:hypothetical protein
MVGATEDRIFHLDGVEGGMELVGQVPGQVIRARIARPSSDRRRSPARRRLRHSSTTSTTAIPSVLPRPGLQRRHQSLGRPPVMGTEGCRSSDRRSTAWLNGHHRSAHPLRELKMVIVALPASKLRWGDHIGSP